ncbi:MAG: extracellular solute-binding protein, partial [Pseudomonadota bacterium]
MRLKLKLASTATVVAIAATATVAHADVLFWSTQARPVEEAQAMRQQVLSGHSDAVDYQPNEEGPWLTRFQAELQAGSGSIGVLGALHGNFSALDPEALVDLDDLGVSAESDTFNTLARLGTDKLQYLPWMQASYIMAANKEALQYLPEGADIDALTYDELIAWAANAHEATGSPKFGFPAGPKGLKHRFFQGYLYPSYTDGVVRTFASDAAVTAWEKFGELWEHTNPASTNFSFMQEQLL